MNRIVARAVKYGVYATRGRRYVCSAPRLKEFGVEMLDRAERHLRCLVCGQDWYARPVSRVMPRRMSTRAALPRGYWQCPNRCNAH